MEEILSDDLIDAGAKQESEYRESSIMTDNIGYWYPAFDNEREEWQTCIVMKSEEDCCYVSETVKEIDMLIHDRKKYEPAYP